MGLLNKLKGILFDEVTEEIPVITKEEPKQVVREEPRRNVREEEPKRRVIKNENPDEVVIHKIETPKRERRIELPDDDEPFDMPKLKEEAKEEVKRSNFTFPVYADDESDVISTRRREQKEERVKETPKPKEKEPEAPKRRESTGYTNAYDYSYGKYKGDYKTSREQTKEILTKTLEEKEDHRSFTPSPIISPVYGVLNENYKKEDIVSKKETRAKKSDEPLDLDSVRRKAYGTLEDEIEVSLSKKDITPVIEEQTVPDYEEDDEGISIDDLLVDRNETSNLDGEDSDDTVEDTIEPEIELDDDTELFRTMEEEEEKITLDEEEVVPTSEENGVHDRYEDDAREEVEHEKAVPPISALVSDNDGEPKMEKTKNKKDSLGEEDLFDLIESIYEGKGEE